MTLECIATAGGAILFDPMRVNNASELFDLAAWRARGAIEERQGGRGSVAFLDAGARHYVLRRYLRGGLPARLSRDRYLWRGEEGTRSFHELRLLDQLEREGLPVPAPVAARYIRTGLTYRAELVTLRLPSCASLTERLLEQGIDDEAWRAIGRTIRRFHDAGLRHADLNAQNVMLGDAGEVWLLDFDRARRCPPGRWTLRVLARLERSLDKLGRRYPGLAWRDGFGLLLAAHDAGPAGSTGS
jgi:3-deoxy-D-manno-octulosonic acid kinase